MTNEEAKQILERIMNNNFYGGEVRTACKIGIEALSQPSLPSNLDEAAEEIVKDWLAYGDGEYKKLVIAGAELIARQGYTKEGIAHPDDDEIWVNIKNTNIKDGDKVIVQIRKK